MSFLIRVGAIAALVALIYFGLAAEEQKGLVQGRAEVQAKWDKEKREVAEAEKAALLTRVKNNERIAEQQALDNDKILKENKDEKNAIRAAYAKSAGLRLAASSVCGGPAASAEAQSAPGGNAALAGTVALPEKINRDLQDLMEEADTVVANCRVTQSFVRLNGMYSATQSE